MKTLKDHEVSSIIHVISEMVLLLSHSCCHIDVFIVTFNCKVYTGLGLMQGTFVRFLLSILFSIYREAVVLDQAYDKSRRNDFHETHLPQNVIDARRESAGNDIV